MLSTFFRGSKPPPAIFFTKLGVFWPFLTHNWPKNIPKTNSLKIFKIYKVCTIFWCQVYPNRIKIKGAMLFSFFYYFLVKICFLRRKKHHPKKKVKKSLKSYFSSDLDKFGTKILCKSYILWKWYKTYILD